MWLPRADGRRRPAHDPARWSRSALVRTRRACGRIDADVSLVDDRGLCRHVQEARAHHLLTPIDDVTMLDGNPPDGEVYAAVWPGAAVVCAGGGGSRSAVDAGPPVPRGRCWQDRLPGDPLPFEEPFWAGEHPAVDPEDDDVDDPYPLPFDPMELGADALASLFGFVYEGGPSSVETIDPEEIALAVFKLTPRRRKWFGRSR